MDFRRGIRVVCGLWAVVGIFVVLTAWNGRTEAHRRSLNFDLAAATRRDDMTAILSLIAEGADPDTPSDYAPVNETLWQRVRRMLAREPAPINGEGETALFRAAAYGDTELLHALIDRHVNVNRTAVSGYTALHLAAGMEDDHELASQREAAKGDVSYQACKMLLEAGANPNIGDPFDGPPLRHAIHQKSEVLERLFLDHGAKWSYADRFWTTCLWDAVSNQRLWLVRKWLAEGANPNETETVHRVTLLMEAIYSGNVELIRLLLDAGARVNDVDMEQETALLIAMREKVPYEVVKLLVECGARTDLRDWDHKSAMDYARERGDRRIVRLLNAPLIPRPGLFTKRR